MENNTRPPVFYGLTGAQIFPRQSSQSRPRYESPSRQYRAQDYNRQRAQTMGGLSNQVERPKTQEDSSKDRELQEIQRKIQMIKNRMTQNVEYEAKLLTQKISLNEAEAEKMKAQYYKMKSMKVSNNNQSLEIQRQQLAKKNALLQRQLNANGQLPTFHELEQKIRNFEKSQEVLLKQNQELKQQIQQGGIPVDLTYKLRSAASDIRSAYNQLGQLELLINNVYRQQELQWGQFMSANQELDLSGEIQRVKHKIQQLRTQLSDIYAEQCGTRCVTQQLFLNQMSANTKLITSSQLAASDQGKASKNADVPLSTNFQDFKNLKYQHQYIDYLYQDSQDKSKLSQQYRYRMLLFYTLFILLFGIQSISSIVLAHNDLQSYEWAYYTTGSSCFIILLCVIQILLQLTVKGITKYNQLIYLILGLIAALLLIFQDTRIFYKIAQDYEPEFDINIQIYLVVISYWIKKILYSMYHPITVYLGLSYLWYTIVIIIVQPIPFAGILYEQILLLLVFVMLTIQTQSDDWKKKQTFWKNHKQLLEQTQLQITPNSSGSQIFSFLEQIVQDCETVKKNLKSTIRAVIFKDVKAVLKESKHLIDKIKQNLGRKDVFFDENFVINQEMDNEDKAFIKENFVDLQHSQMIESFNFAKSSLSDLSSRQNMPFTMPKFKFNSLQSCLNKIGKDWNFDIWFVHNLTGHSIKIVGKYMMQRWDLNAQFNIPEKVSNNYFKLLEKGYHKNPYHNACHAADVMHTLFYFLMNSSAMKEISSLNGLECLIASLAHDIGHPGLTNRFLVNTRDQLAIQYNDISVLENMHCATAFSIMNESESNILCSLQDAEWFQSRKVIIDMILATDMTKHFVLLGSFKTQAINLGTLSWADEQDKATILSTGLKCADLGHSAKTSDLHLKWTDFVCDEFFQQGNLEKTLNIPVSMYCDKETTNVPKSQIGFIKNICIPLYEVWIQFLNSELLNEVCLEQLKMNILMWQSKSKVRRKTVHMSQQEELRKSNPLYHSHSKRISYALSDNGN